MLEGTGKLNLKIIYKHDKNNYLSFLKYHLFRLILRTDYSSTIYEVQIIYLNILSSSLRLKIMSSFFGGNFSIFE